MRLLISFAKVDLQLLRRIAKSQQICFEECQQSYRDFPGSSDGQDYYHGAKWLNKKIQKFLADKDVAGFEKMLDTPRSQKQYKGKSRWGWIRSLGDVPSDGICQDIYDMKPRALIYEWLVRIEITGTIEDLEGFEKIGSDRKKVEYLLNQGADIDVAEVEPKDD